MLSSHSMENAIIEVENVSFGYEKGNDAIQDISFVVPEGSVTMLIGPNGSGKTTLLKTLVGLLRPTKGNIRVLGGKPKEKRKYIGYVPQRLHFDHTFPITVYEFLNFSHPRIPKDIIEVTLEDLGVYHLRSSLVGQLSGGQLQRVLIARSLLGNPKILFLDEPVSGIDIGGEQNFYELIQSIHRRLGVTVIMVSHEVQLVSRVATQVICINRKLVCSGGPDRALLPEVIEKLYGKDISLYKHDIK
jgi:zinc transport system ATP-binding protein